MKSCWRGKFYIVAISTCCRLSFWNDHDMTTASTTLSLLLRACTHCEDIDVTSLPLYGPALHSEACESYIVAISTCYRLSFRYNHDMTTASTAAVKVTAWHRAQPCKAYSMLRPVKDYKFYSRHNELVQPSITFLPKIKLARWRDLYLNTYWTCRWSKEMNIWCAQCVERCVCTRCVSNSIHSRK